MTIKERLATLEAEVKSIKVWIKLLLLVTLGSSTAQIYL